MPQQCPARVLIARLSAIGDVIHSMPLACALRDRLPGVFVAWVVEGRGGDLLEGHPAIDELVRVPRRWLKSPKEVLRLRRRLGELQCNVAIDPQGLTKSAVAARLSGARRRIGFAGRDGREFSRLLNNELVLPRTTHVIDRNLELLRPLGIENPAVAFRVPQRPDDEATIDSLIRQTELNDGFAVINPGAGWPSKRWPAERFAAVAKWLGQSYRLPSVVVWAGNEELHLAEQIVAGSDSHARLAPPTTLTELAALVRRGRLFVAADTGPLHLAVAVGTPSVGLFGPMPHERNGPYGAPHAAIQQARIQGGSRQRRNASDATMRAISVEHVVRACESLLGQGDAARPSAA